jgi:hypothetical protein
MPDQELITKLEEVIGDKDKTIQTESFEEQEGKLWVTLRFKGGLFGSKTLKYPLKPITELFDGEGERVKIITGEEDEYLSILFPIESSIVRYYNDNPEIKDNDVIIALQGLIKFLDEEPSADRPLRQEIHRSLRVTLSLNSYTHQETLAALEHVLKSVKLHKSLDGPTGYLDFIIEQVLE